jgi:hypothetical protein
MFSIFGVIGCVVASHLLVAVPLFEECVRSLLVGVTNDRLRDP